MQESVMQRMWNSAYLSGSNAAYVEELYELYLHDPNACLLYTSPSPQDQRGSRMPSSA